MYNWIFVLHTKRLLHVSTRTVPSSDRTLVISQNHPLNFSGSRTEHEIYRMCVIFTIFLQLLKKYCLLATAWVLINFKNPRLKHVDACWFRTAKSYTVSYCCSSKCSFCVPTVQVRWLILRKPLVMFLCVFLIIVSNFVKTPHMTFYVR